MANFLGNDEEIDFDRAASAFPDISLDGEDFGFPASAGTGATGLGAGPIDLEFDSFESPPPLGATPSAVKVTGDDEIEKFENEFPEIDIPAPAPAQRALPSYTTPKTPFAPRPQPGSFSTTPMLNQAIQEEEPETIRQWREKQAEEIKARDEASKARRQETISAAERSIDEFYENYAKTKERNIRENKEQEESYLQHLQDSLSTGTTWDRISDLIELQNSQSKTIARTGAGTSDLTRFKEVLLRLRREGETAPGAAGY
ncbi:hypothetical protein BDN72DRAFT_886338 [Pluteus cervinus]|uniref:Uncharacterized protein n=1 Tax=Pluteus cervinus TaxID=181527 RepID=A0ACD3B9G1_9AGAR|nr:hypothetical protein BDN72DRAFT_886338 [Pluteus cervinus]